MTNTYQYIVKTIALSAREGSVTDKVRYIVFDKENEAYVSVGNRGRTRLKANEYTRTSIGCSSSRAGWQDHAERHRVGAFADNVSTVKIF